MTNERRYSTIWNRGSDRVGSPTLTTRLFLMVQPLAMATWPPTATTLASSWITRISSLRARWSRIESASRDTKYGAVEALMPAFRASAFPPFSLSMTMRRITLEGSGTVASYMARTLAVPIAGR